MSDTDLIIYGVVTLFSATFSGIVGGGGGFIATPLAIFLGLTPQQAIASGKLGGLAITVGSLHKLQKAKLHNWRIVIPLMILATVIGVSAPLVIINLDNDSYRQILGVLLIAMIPVLFYKKAGQEHKQSSQLSKIFGGVLLVVAMFTQAIFSSGMGALVNVVLVTFLGMSALEANVTKRFSQLILNSLLVIGLLGSGLIVWKVALVGMATGFIGGQLGSRIALKKGNKFVMYMFAVAMLLAGLELLFG